MPSCVGKFSEKTGAPPTRHTWFDRAVWRVQSNFYFSVSTRFPCLKRQVIALVSRPFRVCIPKHNLNRFIFFWFLNILEDTREQIVRVVRQTNTVKSVNSYNLSAFTAEYKKRVSNCRVNHLMAHWTTMANRRDAPRQKTNRFGFFILTIL